MIQTISRILGTVSLGILASAAPAQNDTFLEAPKSAPEYRLSNLRVEDDQFGRTLLVFDYSRTREGEGRVQLAGRTESGPLRITFSPDVNQSSGEVRLSKMLGGRGGAYNYEFFFVVPAYWAGKRYGDCPVSNSVRMGNPGPGVSPRSWNEDERAAYEKQQLSDTPPSGAPEGYERADSRTPLVPGMPVQAGRYSEWVDAEVLALADDGKVTIRYRGEETADTVDRDGWIAVDPDALQKARAEPDAFQASMRVLPGGKHPLPRDAVAIEPGLELGRGVPLLLYRGFEWQDVFVVDDMGPKIKVRYDDHVAKFDWDHMRTELAIRRETLAQLNQPGGARRFAAELDEVNEILDEDEITLSSEDKWGREHNETYHVTNRNYPIETKIPRGAVVVPDDVELPEGVPVAYCWARRWEAATLIADRGRKLVVKEDDNVSSFAWRIDRDQVIIEKKTLRKLSQQRGAKAAELKQTLRTWTDASGQHKVEARFVRVADGKVTLKTDAGREINLPLDRLCDEDQALLEDIEPETENPFE